MQINGWHFTSYGGLYYVRDFYPKQIGKRNVPFQFLSGPVSLTALDYKAQNARNLF